MSERKAGYRAKDKREIYDTMTEVEEWCPGVVAGPGARPHIFFRRRDKRAE